MRSDIRVFTKLFNLGLLSLLFVAGSLTILGQTPLSARPDRGMSDKGGYQASEIDAVSLQNGTVNVQIPLASLPPSAGGKLGYTLTASYNSKLWDMLTKEQRIPPGGPPGCPTSYSTQEMMPSANGGWKIGGTYEIFFRDANEDYDYIEPDLETCYGAEWYHMAGRFFKPMLRMPDGSEHELRAESSLPTYAGTRDHLKGYYNYDGAVNQPTFSGNVRFYTTDGSFLSVIYRPAPDPVRWTIYFKDGMRVEASNDGQRTIDTNGNSILQGGRLVGSVWENFVKDEYTGREIKWSPITYNGQANGATKVEYQSIGGAWQQVTVVWGTTTVFGKTYTVTGWNPNGGEFGQGGTCDVSKKLAGDQGTVFPVIREVIYPQTEQGIEGRKYSFGYNSDETSTLNGSIQEFCGSGAQPQAYNRTISYGWGQLNEIDTPTGAKIQYEYTFDDLQDSSATGTEVLKDFVKKKKVTHDGETDTWVYTINNYTSSFPSVGSVTNPDGSWYTESYNPTNSAYAGFGGATGAAGLLVRTSNSSGVVTERKWKALGGTLPAYGSTDHNGVNNVVEAEYTTYFEGQNRVKMTAKKFDHDYNGDVKSVTEYDWFAPGEITFTTFGTFFDLPNSFPADTKILRVTENTLINSAANASSATAYHKRNVESNLVILGKPQEVAVRRNATTNPKSRTQFFYDGLSLGGSPVKGNVTKVAAWDDSVTSGQWLNTTTTYTSKGNPEYITDANGNVTRIHYDEINGKSDLYPTKTVAAYGTAVARTSSTVYDFSTGLVRSTIDNDNSNLTVETDYDVLGRPVKLKNALGTPLESWTVTDYRDSSRKVIVKSDIETKGDSRNVAIQHFDELGRVFLSRTLDDPLTQDPLFEGHGIKVETRYKTSGACTFPGGATCSFQITSNPFKAATASAAGNEETMGWTMTQSRIDGKYSEVQTFGGAGLPQIFGGGNANSTGIIKTSVDIDVTTVTDQAGKLRRSVVNSLGQLIRVDEPDKDGVLGAVTAPKQPTDYQYDVLGNLTQVQQLGDNEDECVAGQTNCTQTRTFTYSSLSRLLTAANPESGTITYTYENGGNLKTRLDARGVKTTYVYDQLNRIKERNYTTPSGAPQNYQASPDVRYAYDNPAIANSRGKLTKVTTGTGATPLSVTEYQEFDLLGRAKQSQQWIEGTAYGVPMMYSYNLSGGLTEQKYPSGRIVRNTLDTDGSLTQVQSQRNGGTFQNYANGYSYNAAGAITAMRLGNGKWESTKFNSRLQPKQIALGTSVENPNLLRLDYTYSTTGNPDNNGNVLSQTIAVPSVGSNPGFVATQTYSYDSLNRLAQATENIQGQTPPSWKQTFKYDRYGNRSFDTDLNRTTTIPIGCPTAVCNPGANPSDNKLKTSDGYHFDNGGNTTKDAELRKFTYDGENKQVKVETVNSSDVVIGTVGEYLYDGDGRRIKKYVPPVGGNPAETTVFVYDAFGKLVAEYSTNVASVSTAKIAYLTNDHLGSPRINTDAVGAVTARNDYHPFGEQITSLTSSQRSSALQYMDDAVRKKFTGYERDKETELDFAQARYYAKGLGRYQTPDEIFNDQSPGAPQTWNLYLYVANNPLSFIDATGKWKEVPCTGGNSGGRSCYESDRADDTYQSLAELLGVPHQFLSAFFGNQAIELGKTFDANGFDEWLKENFNAEVVDELETIDRIEITPFFGTWSKGRNLDRYIGGPLRRGIRKGANFFQDLFGKRKQLTEFFTNGAKPKASQLAKWAEDQGWTKVKSPTGPVKYFDEKGTERLVLKRGSSRAPGSGDPHVEMFDANHKRIGPDGNHVTRKSPENHTPIEYDLD